LQNMSHEIRTPMNAIMGFSSLIVGKYNDKNKLESYSKIINQRSSDLLSLINDLLDVAKIESGQLAVNMEECSLKDLFSELNIFFLEYQKRINKQHIKFIFSEECLQTKYVIITDKIKLKQILINLLSNAFKFTYKGSIEVGCKFEIKNQLTFNVKDTGIGIPADKQQLVFGRFSQLNNGTPKQVGGTGLGLSIVEGLINLLGGKVWLESEEGKGSNFYFTIPFHTSQLSEKKQLIVDETIEYNFNGKTILIVEDDQYNASYLKEVLENTNSNIIMTELGRDAVQISIQDSIDMILMDIRLPDIDGYDATRQIKAQRPLIKIIAQTAYASDDEKSKAQEAGCDDYISKPTDQFVLLAMIARHFQ
jgi:CheY-like chemotaxis protein/two-component sensor histidine kinase